jgi:FkbM family methyltransferase
VVNWSSIGQKSALGQLLRAPLAAIPKSAVVPILAGPNRGFLWRVGAADHGCWLGSYEHEMQQALWRARVPGATVLDLGANVGFYTLLLSRAVGIAGQVIAFEPDRRNAACLRLHTRLNHISNVHVVVGAAAARRGTVTFSPGPTHTTGRVVSTGHGRAVNAYRLDDLVFGGGMQVPALVKMDIEGGEADALAGAGELLAAQRTIWFVAMHSREQAEACAAAFRCHNYRLAFLNGGDVPSGHETSLSEVVAIPASTTPDV